MHHLIFEGAELSGKSWIMSQIYDHLEPKYNQNGFILDGCHWFNTDIGIYGTRFSQNVMNSYLEIFSTLSTKNLITEKFHISDLVYRQINKMPTIQNNEIEKKLTGLGFKIILITMPEDAGIVQKRLNDRLNLYPHYSRIAQSPEWYIDQQKKYIEAVKQSPLPYLIVPTENLPDTKPIQQILTWINEL